ncbi:MAG: leucine-rich repeat domain-containing protein [Thermoguttaceae bacterium]|nr:leucine-rich repeat domain-containing protein [Thermoguttaceae bacterium]MBQ9127671.1 leucine-rich repeat domain-containing protein [Thermoguttaceae bacterium]
MRNNMLERLSKGKTVGRWLALGLLVAFAALSGGRVANASDEFGWSFDEEGATLTAVKDASLTTAKIPEKVKGKPVVAIGENAFFACRSLETVKLPKSLKRIESGAFIQCASLEYLDLPEGLTEIGPGAFWGCISLRVIELPLGVTKIERLTFMECQSLKTVDMAEKVTSIGHSAFLNCSSLRKIELPESLESIDDLAFGGCRALKKVELPANLENIGLLAFACCDSLETLDYSRLDEGRFEEDVFGLCDPELEIVLDEDRSVSAGDALEHLRALRCESSDDETDDETDDEATVGEFGLTEDSEEIPAAVSAVDFFEWEFDDNGATLTGVKDKETLTTAQIPAEVDGKPVVSIGCEAFKECKALKTVALPDSVTTIENGAFAFCKALESIEFSENLTTIKALAFYDCGSLKSVDFPEKVTTVENLAFVFCTSLKEARFRNPKLGFSEHMFEGCDKKMKIILANGTTSTWEVVLLAFEAKRQGLLTGENGEEEAPAAEEAPAE